MKEKENVIHGGEEERRRTATKEIGNSVFTLLFRNKKRALGLYRLLNPADTTVKRSDIRIVLVRNVIGKGFYNEIGFLVRESDLYIIEAQTRICPGTGLRMSEDWLKLCLEHGANSGERQSGSPTLPEMLIPHFHAVYTGKGNPPPSYTEKDVFRGKSDFTYTIPILTKDNTKGILREYCLLASRLESEREACDAENAAEETVRYCLSAGILKNFITQNIFRLRRIMMKNIRQEEIYDIMAEESRKKTELIEEKDRTIKQLEKEIERLKKLLSAGSPDNSGPVPA